MLDGCEIRVFRNDGELNVVFLPATEFAQQFLKGHETRFHAILVDRLGDDRIRVEIEPANRNQAFAEHNDGRSRQRYVPQDENPMPG